MGRGRSRSSRRHGGGKRPPAKNTGPGTGRIPPTTCPEARGILLWIVRGDVPVISFENAVSALFLCGVELGTGTIFRLGPCGPEPRGDTGT